MIPVAYDISYRLRPPCTVGTAHAHHANRVHLVRTIATGHAQAQIAWLAAIRARATARARGCSLTAILENNACNALPTYVLQLWYIVSKCVCIVTLHTCAVVTAPAHTSAAVHVLRTSISCKLNGHPVAVTRDLY